ncbi:MAG TPA: hypothetical protein DCS29_02060 [Candidatus Magasanikbacteria bacterium]|nr:MAG: hypothetical protein A2479_00380 [Candidatus Magasanikbacteria bacterium RIFOXYC2_FULL_39_8]HAT03540.1 hypothetical protein [Candidatus Magasanikbacteria bacterium]
MRRPAVQHTITIFEKIHRDLPPLVPEDIIQEMGRYLKSLQTNSDVSLLELEQVMIDMGKQIWPYMQAFGDIYRVYEDKLAEKLLAQKASPMIRDKYHMFKEMGGSFRDLYHGSVHEMFDENERGELVELLVDLKEDIRKHAIQATMTHDQELYTQKIEEYGKIIHEINSVIKDLHALANEEEHEDFARDIHGRAHAIGQSLIFLGPKMSIEEIRGSHDYYKGKKEDRRMRIM